MKKNKSTCLHAYDSQSHSAVTDFAARPLDPRGNVVSNTRITSFCDRVAKFQHAITRVRIPSYILYLLYFSVFFHASYLSSINKSVRVPCASRTLSIFVITLITITIFININLRGREFVNNNSTYVLKNMHLNCIMLLKP